MAQLSTVANGELAPNSSGDLTEGFGGRIGKVKAFFNQPSIQRALPTLAAVLLLPIGLFIYFAIQTPHRTTLYASLPEAEKAKVVDALRNMGVSVSLDPSTGEVTVPVDDYHSARLGLAAQGLPASVPGGYNALGDMPMGASRSVETMKLKQSQEVELAKSISRIDIVTSARVHLAIPERSVFARKSLPPKASVFLNLARGRTLSPEQVTAIVNLVSSAVPNMSRDNVAVVDQVGRLISNNEMDAAARLTDKQFQHRLQMENVYRTRIEMLLGPVVGAGNITAQVSVSLDFTKKSKAREVFDKDGRVVRSERMLQEETSKKPAVGIPGSISNTPPAEAEQKNPDDAEPVTSANSDQQGKDNKQNVMSRKNSVKNYDISRTVLKEETPMAIIKQINVAILMKKKNIKNPTPEEGGKIETGLNEKQIKELEQLVESALALDKKRGDTIVILERPFVKVLEEGIIKQWYEEKWIKDLALNFMTFLIMAVLALGVVKPLVSRIVFSSKADQTLQQAQLELIQADDELGSIEVKPGESLEDIKSRLKPKATGISAEMLDTANSYDDKVAIIRMIVGDEAGRVSNVFKEMMQEDPNQA